MLRSAWASRSRCCEALVDERCSRSRRERLGIAVDDETLAQRLATAPEFQENGRFMGADEMRRRLELQGITVAEFEAAAAAAASCASSSSALVTDGVTVTPAEAEQRVPPPQRAGQGRVRAWSPPTSPAPTRHRRRGARRASRRARTRYRFPERRVRLLPAGRRAAAAAARHGHRRATSSALLRGAPATSSSRPSRSAPATSWSRSRPRRRRRRATPTRRRASSRRPRWTRSRRGADFAARGEEDLRGPGLGAAGRRPRLLRARPHGAGVRERRLRPGRPGRPRTW